MFGRVLFSLAAFSCLAPPLLADVDVLGIPPVRWGALEGGIGVGGMTIESFEDAKLGPGLQVRWIAAAGSVGPTNVLPNTFNPATDDPFGTAFVGGVWHGSNVLVNTRTNRPFPYPQSDNWGDVELLFDPPATTVAFSTQQLDLDAAVVVNGVGIGNLLQRSGLPGNPNRTGYFIIDARPGESISSLLINNTGGDGFVIDYLAFTAQPRPRLSVSLTPPAQWGAPDAALGFASATIEDFEDAALATGLQVEWESPAGNTPATPTLPSVFAPVTDDPFGSAFDFGVWDGTRCLINTRDNQSRPYDEVASWGDVVFHFAAPVSHVAFAMGDLNLHTIVAINERASGTLAGVPTGPRQGFVRMAVAGEPSISSIRLLNGRETFSDGIAIDHLAFMNCAVDINADSFVNSQDFFDFLTAFFAGAPAADFNADALTNSQDFFDFLTVFFSGC